MSRLFRETKRSNIFLTGFILLIIFIVTQFIRPEIKNLPVSGDINAPKDVEVILKRACYDCHSNETRLSWFDKISPAYWHVAKHVRTGRSLLNFSEWASLSPPEKKLKLWEAVNQVSSGAMPLHDYAFIHPSAEISVAELAVLKNYLAAMVDLKPTDTAKANAADAQYKQWQQPVPPEGVLPKTLNGISYDPGYKNWQAMSTTERFDSKTMRVIFGNDIAVKALIENNIRPWPDGTKFAKAAWTQIADKDGNIRTGLFLQVAFMIKDAKKYASTGGWGFATFQTPKMVPYGKTVLFANECINCHRPLKNADYVYTLPIKQMP